jgi:dnd system-associated protein 4
MSEKRQNPPIRRPQDHDELIKRLTAKDKYRNVDTPFTVMYDLLVFAASLGFKLEKRVPFSKSGEPIDFATMKSNAYFEQLLSTIAVLTFEGDHTCLSDDRLAERIRLFEEYANGGLIELSERLKNDHPSPSEYLETLISQEIANI